MKLKDCTKEELIHIVNYIAGRISLLNKDYYIESALAEVEYKRKRKMLDRAEELNQLSAQKRNAYIEILKPYNGMKYADIPFDVLCRASALQKEAQKADKEWVKIMKEVDTE